MWYVSRAFIVTSLLAPVGFSISVNFGRAADITIGSGVVIGAHGEVLTNAHVVENCSKIAVRSSAAYLVARDEKNDLAVVQSSLPASPVAVFREGGPVRAGDAVVALGYPLFGLLASTANLSVGNVSALAGLGDDSRYLQISAPVHPGNSGGPLLDTSGHLIGIVTSKLDAARMFRFFGDIPQNVNFALKAEVARTFLDSKGIVYQTARSEQQLSPPDVGEIARPFTVRVDCQQPAAAGQPRYRASLNLNLRASPDMGSPNLLGRWSPDYIPQGTIFVGEPKCINEWCSISYQHDGVKTTGWVNGWYLEKLP